MVYEISDKVVEVDPAVTLSKFDEDAPCGPGFGVLLSHWPADAVAWYLSFGGGSFTASLSTLIALPRDTKGCFLAWVVYADGREQMVLPEDEEDLCF